MKITRNLSRTLAVIAFVVFVLFQIIAVITGNQVLLLLGSISPFVFILGVAFIFAKNDVVVKVGYGLLMYVGILHFSLVFSNDTISLIFGIVIFALLIVAVMAWFVASVLHYFGYIKGDALHLDNPVALNLEKVKRLLTKQTISDADYGALKAKILDTSLSASDRNNLTQRIVLLEKGLIEISDVL